MAKRLRSPRLIGRAAYLAALGGVLSEAAHGRGAAVLIVGEAGVGKTRLLTECVAQAAAAGLATFHGHAVEGGGAYRPLSDALMARQREALLPEPTEIGPFAGVLARLVPGWATTPAGEWVPDLSLLISEGMLRLLQIAGQDGGALLALDDIHLADSDSLAVLERIADSVANYPIVVVATARDEQRGELDRLRRVPDLHVMPLRRLSRDEVAAMMVACTADAVPPDAAIEHIVDNADGLPFLVEELLTGLVESGVMVRTAAGWDAPADVRAPVPASFAAVVHARLEGLTPAARTVVETAAVIGRHVDWRLLPTITGRSDTEVLDALRLATDRQLVVHDDHHTHSFRFVHALTREAVADRLLPPQRIAIALSVARTLDHRGGDVKLAAEMYAAAGDGRRAAELLSLAATDAGGAVETREQLLRRALALEPSHANAVALVETLVLAGRVTEASELGEQIFAELSRDDPLRRSLALSLARGFVVASSWARAEGYLTHAGGGAEVDALAAHVAFGEQRPDDAERLARTAVSSSASPHVLCEALEVIGRCARHRDRSVEAEATFAHAAEIASQHSLTSWRIRALHELGTLDLLGPARPDRLELAHELAVAAGMLSTAAQIDLQLMGCHGLLVDHKATLTVAKRGEDLALSLGLPVLAGAARMFVALVFAHQGEQEKMRRAIKIAVARAGEDLDQAAFVPFIEGVPKMVAHDLDGWRPTLEAGMQLVRQNPAASPTPFRGLYALLETVLDDGDAAREELRGSGATVQAANRAALHYADAIAGARGGEDPSERLEAADVAMAPLTWRRHHARLLIAAPALRDGWGRPLEWLREANGYFTSVGELALARACRAQLRAAGAAIPRRGRGDNEVPPHLLRRGVTSRETDVLLLIAQGLSNQAIAKRLYLSPRTVDTHVANLLAKTGAGNRTALITLLRSR